MMGGRLVGVGAGAAVSVATGAAVTSAGAAVVAAGPQAHQEIGVECDYHVGILQQVPRFHRLPECHLRAAARPVAVHRLPLVPLHLDYDSEAAFNRAFKRELGSTPAAWRRRPAAAPRPG